jgi:hypothetical protein
MKIEYTIQEIKAIILAHTNKTVVGGGFDAVQAGRYDSLPSTFIVSTEEKDNAAQ